MGPGGIPLARRDNPVTLPIYSDNEPIASGLNAEKGPLEPLQLGRLHQPGGRAEVRAGAQRPGLDHDLRERGRGDLEADRPARLSFDVWWGTVDYISRAVAGKLIQPINLSYIPNLKNVWPSLQNPYYDQHSRYTVPYTVYTTGIAYRTDNVKKAPADYANPYDIFWDSHAVRREGRDPRRPARGARDDAAPPPHLRRQHREPDAGQPGARRTCRELTSLANVKVNVNDYTDVPSGATYISQAWSGDMAGAPSTCRRASRPPCSATGVRTYTRETQNDMITSSAARSTRCSRTRSSTSCSTIRTASRTSPGTATCRRSRRSTPNTVVSQGYIPANLTSTIVREVGLQEGRDDRRADDAGPVGLAERVVELQGRVSGAGPRSGPDDEALVLAVVRACRACLAAPALPRPHVRGRRGRFRDGRPDLRGSGSGLEPAPLAVHDDEVCAQRTPAGPHLLDRLRADARATSRSRSRAAC